MSEKSRLDITDILGKLQYRIALAGGWIDQPFVSKHNPSPPGSMVVVAVEPQFRWMDRAGICGSTRKIALDIWGDELPDEPPEKLVRQLYEAENKDKSEPSGSQDMIGLIYPGINRLDFDYEHEGGYFPVNIESYNDQEIANWLEDILYILPVNMRPDGYNPLERKNIDPEWVRRLSKSGKDCFDAVVNKDINMLGQSMNECMQAWHTLLPDILKHHTLRLNLVSLLKYYQANYPGAMYSGCGGGYLYVVSEKKVPGGFQVKIRTDKRWQKK